MTGGGGSDGGDDTQQRNLLEMNNAENRNAVFFRNENKRVRERRDHIQKPCLY